MYLFIFQMPLGLLCSPYSWSKIRLPLGIHILRFITGSYQGLNLSWLPQETEFKVAICIHKLYWGGLYGYFSFMRVREVGLGRGRNWNVMTLQQRPQLISLEPCWLWALQKSPTLGKEVQVFESYIHHSVDEGCPTEARKIEGSLL